MNNELPRVLLIQDGCPFCRKYLGFIQKFNATLPPEKRIMVENITEYEKYGILLNPILKKIQYKGTPTLYIDGVVLEGITTVHYLKGFLNKLMDDEGNIKSYPLKKNE